MKIRRVLAAAAGVAITATTLFVAPVAHADELGNTDVTFTLVNGTLSIAVSGATTNAAASKNLGSLTPDGVLAQVEGDLVSTTVTDNRNSLTSVYTVSANCDDFSDGGTNTIAKSNVLVSAGTLSAATLGGSSVTPGSLFLATAGATCGASASPLGSRAGAAAVTTLLGTLTGVTSANNAVTYTPHMVVTIPPNTPNATYSTTVYQTVA
jgi:hypothetical protein